MRNYALLALKLALTGGLIWYAFQKVDVASAWETLRSARPGPIAGALALLLVQIGLASIRLCELLDRLGYKYTLGNSFLTVYVGSFFNQTLVSFVGGDAMRVWRLVRGAVPVGDATKAVVLDRIAGFAAMVAIVIATLPFLVPALESVEMTIGVFLIGAGALGAVFSVFVLRRIPQRFLRWAPLQILVRFVSLGLDITRNRRSAALVFGVSLGIQVLNVLTLFALARGLRIDIGLGDCFVLVPTVLFLSMLPISFAGWGVREGAMVAALAIAQVEPHQSLALSISYGLSLIAVSLPGGIIWLASRHKPLPA